MLFHGPNLQRKKRKPNLYSLDLILFCNERAIGYATLQKTSSRIEPIYLESSWFPNGVT